MGADLIIQDVIIRQKPTIALWDKIEKALDKRVDKMSEDELKGWDEEVSCGSSDDVEELREEAHAVVTTAINDLRNPCRDMTWISIPIPNSKDVWYIYIAGGMSWGDSPGESYEELYKFNILFSDYRFIDEVLEEHRPKCNVCGKKINTDDEARDCCDKCLIETKIREGKMLAKLKLGKQK